MSEALDAAMGVLGRLVKEGDDVLRGTLGAMLRGYDDHWYNSGWYPVPGTIEQEFCLPILNPFAKHTSSSRTFVYAGKLDLMVCHPDLPGQIFLADHKSASEDIEDQDSTYWRRLRIDPQASTYMLAAWQSGTKLDGALWDVLRKPTIKPKALTKAAVSEIFGQQKYCGQKVSAEVAQAVTKGELTSENGELFGLRFYSEICENPNKYFQRRPVPRSDADLVDIAAEIWGIAEAARDCHSSDKWLKTGSPHGCMTYGRACEYLGICSGYDRPESHHWQINSNLHSELKLENKPDALKVLTNSSMGVFKLCQKKYQYRYVLGIKKEETSESLYLGSILHECLEAYWAKLPIPPEAKPMVDAEVPMATKSVIHEEIFA